MRLKISDMGLARKLEQDQSSFETVAGGSFGWRASEQILGKKCNKSVDVFTIGCLLCADNLFLDRLFSITQFIAGTMYLQAEVIPSDAKRTKERPTSWSMTWICLNCRVQKP